MIFLVFLFLLFALPAEAAFVEVGSGSQRNGIATGTAVASQDLAFPANVTSGNFIIVGGTSWHSGGTPTASIAATSTCSAALTVVDGTDGPRRDFIAYGPATSTAACTVTVTPADSTYLSFAIDEFSGQHATPLDASPGGVASSGTSATEDITTTVANALIIGTMSHDGTSTTQTPGGSYTEISENEDNSCCQSFSLVYRIATTATTYTVDWTLADTKNWSTLVVSFKPSAGAAPLIRHRPILQ